MPSWDKLIREVDDLEADVERFVPKRRAQGDELRHKKYMLLDNLAAHDIVPYLVYQSPASGARIQSMLLSPARAREYFSVYAPELPAAAITQTVEPSVTLFKVPLYWFTHLEDTRRARERTPLPEGAHLELWRGKERFYLTADLPAALGISGEALKERIRQGREDPTRQSALRPTLIVPRSHTDGRAIQLYAQSDLDAHQKRARDNRRRTRNPDTGALEWRGRKPRKKYPYKPVRRDP